MNMFKKNGGFTLVELIVVIAILAILAGVAIPAYSGYIEKAKDAAVITELDAIQTAAQAACALNGTTVTKITVSNAGAVDITPANAGEDADVASDFATFYTTDATTLGNLLKKHSEMENKTSATWNVGDAANNVKEGWDILLAD